MSAKREKPYVANATYASETLALQSFYALHEISLYAETSHSTVKK
jgi:hypothetical protein